jgi:hypothetical protein
MTLWSKSFFLKSLTSRRAIGIRKIRTLDEEQKVALLHGINPALRAKSPAMTVATG